MNESRTKELVADPDPSRRYRMREECTNCGYRGVTDFAKGVPAAGSTRRCPRCDCMFTLKFHPYLPAVFRP